MWDLMPSVGRFSTADSAPSPNRMNLRDPGKILLKNSVLSSRGGNSGMADVFDDDAQEESSAQSRFLVKCAILFLHSAYGVEEGEL